MIDNLLNQLVIILENEWKVEKEIFIQKNLLGWMKQLQALLRLKNPDAANELSKEIDRMRKVLVQKQKV